MFEIVYYICKITDRNDCIDPSATAPFKGVLGTIEDMMVGNVFKMHSIFPVNEEIFTDTPVQYIERTYVNIPSELCGNINNKKVFHLDNDEKDRFTGGLKITTKKEILYLIPLSKQQAEIAQEILPNPAKE